MQGTYHIFNVFSVTLEGSCEGRVFDEREVKMEIGDGENLGFPPGVEKAIMAMEQGEEALFIMKPKYDHSLKEKCFLSCFISP